MKSMILIKLGGSIITDKNKPLAARPEVIDRLAREIASTGEKFIIVHGGGSFGHFKAAEHCIQEGYKSEEQSQAIADIQYDMRILNSMVVDGFHKASMPVASIPSGAISVFDDGRIVEFPVDVLSHYLDIGITPITFGDVVVDRTRGVCICSGDDIMQHLAKNLEVTKCIFVTEVDGMYQNYPPGDGEEPIPVVVPGDDISFSSDRPDVTGGMERKLELMFDIAATGSEVLIVNGLVPDRVKKAIMGEDFVGTVVKGGN